MTSDRFASAHEMVREYAEVEAKMADPSIHEDQTTLANLDAAMPNLVLWLQALKRGNLQKRI